MSENSTFGTDNVYTSPSEKLKNIILKQLEKTESFYSDGEEAKFINATKSLNRLIFTQIQPAFKTELNKLNKKEFDEIEELWKTPESKMNHEAKVKKRKEIRSYYAEVRMDLLVEAISRSAIIERDMEVDFNIADTVGLDELRELVKRPIEGGSNDSSFN